MDDPWVWRAVFANCATLDEYGDAEASDGRGWDVVAREARLRGTRLASVVLLPTRAGLCPHVVTLPGPLPGPPDASATPSVRIFRRRSLTLDSGSGVEVGARPDPITCVALEWPDGGPAAYTFLFSDGSIVVSPNLNAV